jgi:hypothetical protein
MKFIEHCIDLIPEDAMRRVPSAPLRLEPEKSSNRINVSDNEVAIRFAPYHCGRNHNADDLVLHDFFIAIETPSRSSKQYNCGIVFQRLF